MKKIFRAILKESLKGQVPNIFQQTKKKKSNRVIFVCIVEFILGRFPFRFNSFEEKTAFMANF